MKKKFPFIKILGIIILLGGAVLLTFNILSFSQTQSVPAVIVSVQELNDYKYNPVDVGTSRPCRLHVRLYTDNRIIMTNSDYEPCGSFILPSFRVGQDVRVRMVKNASVAEIDYGNWVLIAPGFLIILGLYLTFFPHPFRGSSAT